MANRITMVTIVSPIAIRGEISAITFERSARFSRMSCMDGLLLIEAASAHQQSKLLAGGFLRRQRLREPPVKHHGDAVGDFGEFVEVLAGDKDCRTGGGEVE